MHRLQRTTSGCDVNRGFVKGDYYVVKRKALNDGTHTTGYTVEARLETLE